MITVKAKESSSASSPLSLGAKSSRGDTNAFSKLLQSISSKGKTGSHGVKESALMLNLNDANKTAETKTAPKDSKEIPKKAQLLSLLKGKEESVAPTDVKTYDINPEISGALDTKSLKTVIQDAKIYLKEQIKESAAYKKGEIKELPKTAKGLVELAKKVGVDIDKITIETLQPKTLKNLKPDKKDIPQKMADIKTDESLKTKQPTQTAEAQQPGAKQESPLSKLLSQDDSLAKMPLFKSQPGSVPVHSTAELVNKKQTKSEEKTISKADSTLRALLHGDKTTPQEAQPQDLKKEPKTESKHKTHSSVLSQLLHGDTQDVKAADTADSSNLNEIKPTLSNGENSLHVKQTESDLTVKIHEAKQMVKYLAQDIKQAIEDYKPPFTRIKVKLNPAKFGEVDLTVVQRGKNVHVNISSNASAINMLSQNANDLKVQLNQNGMNNATLNFNSSSDNQGQQQQNSHQQQNAKQAYEYLEKNETNEEIVTSLEIVVPRYI